MNAAAVADVDVDAAPAAVAVASGAANLFFVYHRSEIHARYSPSSGSDNG